ncbi:MOSC domain-containing protein [Cognatishimia sp. F0-27]|uniref:MOSC domain-containing protein n=1 Tax=Cognatishimia sp. F0-27 TaxID=2816855 RepID=UPI001D0C301D|nr:MOSC domain-containing protein [Cognatishimia sp. F0-27]MCC1491200.1 MOSC domain-containing protein [Cognatishimia sp. F0-27]
MPNCDLRAEITGLFAGQPADLWPGKPPSAIHKTALSGPQQVTQAGFAADQQADLTVHGDADKALHHYATEHYVRWQADGMLPPDAAPAAFGENIATTGVTETDLCIGDVLHFGTALVQVSQGRQPCWKLDAYRETPTMAYHFRKSGRTGWYYRVLEPGVVRVGDTLRLTDRPNPGWTVAEVTHALLFKRIAPAHADALARMPELAPGWRSTFAAMAASD